MNTNRALKGIAFLFLYFCNSAGFCQSKWSDFDFGIHVGTLIYQGDLTPGPLGYTKTIRPMVGLNISKNLTQYFSVRGNVDFGSVLADDSKYSSPAWKKERNFKFSTPVTELSLHGIFNFQGENNRINSHRFQTYIFGGPGISFINIARDFSGFNRNSTSFKTSMVSGLTADSLHTLPRAILVIPMGAGVKYIVGPKISLTAEFTYRLLTTDYLDGFKYAADKNKNDSYYGLSIGLLYKPIFNKYQCPRMKL